MKPRGAAARVATARPDASEVSRELVRPGHAGSWEAEQVGDAASQGVTGLRPRVRLTRGPNSSRPSCACPVRLPTCCIFSLSRAINPCRSSPGVRRSFLGGPSDWRDCSLYVPMVCPLWALVLSHGCSVRWRAVTVRLRADRSSPWRFVGIRSLIPIGRERRSVSKSERPCVIPINPPGWQLLFE
jgi:hypothetical protein